MCESRIDGVFSGYEGGRVYCLMNGQEWHQASDREEIAFREDPVARVLTDGIDHFLDVEGCDGLVRVHRVYDRRGLGLG
jgi:hypothetical protein